MTLPHIRKSCTVDSSAFTLFVAISLEETNLFYYDRACAWQVDVFSTVRKCGSKSIVPAEIGFHGH